jgi:hypothetical protein
VKYRGAAATQSCPRPLPRDVAPVVALRLILGRAAGQIGWAVFGFCMIFFWAFAMNSDVAGWFVFRGTLESASGTVSSVENTGFSEGGSEDSDGIPVHALRYRFTYQGRQYQGLSYQSGVDAPAEGQPEIEGTVTVEFPPGRPDRSRIRDMRSAPFGAGVALVALFPLVGLLLAAGSAWRGWKTYRLLKHGLLEDGSIRASGSGAPWLALLMPVLTIAGHGLYFVLRYLL